MEKIVKKYTPFTRAKDLEPSKKDMETLRKAYQPKE